MTQRRLGPILIALAVICFFPAAAHKQHVAGFDVAALSNRPDVDALVFAAAVKLLPGNRVVVIRIVVDALFVRVASVVEEDAAACDAVFGPVVNRAFVVGAGASDVTAFGLGRVLV